MPVKLNGRVFNKGDFVTLSGKAENYIPGSCLGLSVEIHHIRDGGETIGLYSPNQKMSGWGDLDGMVGTRRGWWLSTTELEKCIDSDDQDYEVIKDLEHRGVQLKGMVCRKLANLNDGAGTIFVEFEKDVNGCSADGLGKAGHCVALSHKILKVKKKKVKHSK